MEELNVESKEPTGIVENDEKALINDQTIQLSDI